MEAEPCNVDPQFAEIVAAGRYKKISASFYLPDSPSNPKPGVMYLRHVGFLGAQPPAIKGLRNSTFASNDEGVVEFSDWADMNNASLWRRMREFLIEKFSAADADRIIPDYSVQSLEADARTPSTTVPNYTEPHQESGTMTPAEIATAQAKLADERRALDAQLATITTKEAAFAEREQSLSTQERAAQHVVLVAHVDGLVSDGKVLPVHKAGLVAFMESLPATTVVEFGEGDKKQSVAPLAWLKSYLEAQPKLVHFGEIVIGEGDTGTADFAAPKGYSVDVESSALHVKAVAHQKANPSMSYVDAVKAVS
jgi:hypothetical protein